MSKIRIPRKNKKLLKNFIKDFDKYVGHGIFSIVRDYTNISQKYKWYKVLLSKYRFYKKHLNAIKRLNYKDEHEVYLNPKTGRLCWYWELDDEYSPKDGLMDLCYSDAEAGDTWAFSELEDTVYFLYQCKVWTYENFDDLVDVWDFPEEIVNDISLLKYVKKELNEKTQTYKEN